MNPAYRLPARAGVLAASAMATLVLVGFRPAGAADSDYGTITGRLVWGGADVPKRDVLVKKGDAAKKDADICSANGDLLSDELVVDPKTKGIEYGVAFLVKPKGTNPGALKALVAKEAKVQIDQKHCEFIPHVTAATKDQTIVFKSSDPRSHNLRYAGFTAGAANNTLPPNGQFTAKLAADDIRPVSLNCDIHPWMTGKLFVFDHPFFSVTKPDGSFVIHGVPAGAQSLVLWHEKTGFVTPNRTKGQPVTVKAGGTTDVGTIILDPKTVK